MRTLNSREKNLGLLVLFFGMMFFWWNTSRNMAKEIATAEATILGTNDQIRNANATLASLQASLAGINAPVASAGGAAAVAHSASSLQILKELTQPAEVENVKILSMNRADALAFSVQVEGKFSEMMRFISYLERSDSRIQLGNIGLTRSGEAVANGEIVRKIKGTIVVALRG